MHTDVLPSGDVFYKTWLQNFASVAAANAVELGLTSEQVDQLTTSNAEFDSAYEAHCAAKIMAMSKRAAKETARAESEAIARSIARFVNGNSTVPDELKAKLGLRVVPVRSGVLECPVDLTVETQPNGINLLRWKRGENPRAVSFIIESRAGLQGPWVIIGFSNKLKYAHLNQTPGNQVFYRVIAFRNDKQSGPSNMAMAYDFNQAAAA